MSSIRERELRARGIDPDKPQGGLTTQEYNNLTSRDRNLLDRQLKISNSQGRLNTTFNPNTTTNQVNRVTREDVGERTAPQLDRGGYDTYTEANPEPRLDRVTGDPGERTAPRLDRGDNSITTQSITRQKNVSGSFDLQTGTAYINGKVVSFEEYNTFINLSNAEKIVKYGQ